MNKTKSRKATKTKEISIQSINYIHDPEAASKWFEIYVELVKKALIKNAIEKMD